MLGSLNKSLRKFTMSMCSCVATVDDGTPQNTVSPSVANTPSPNEDVEVEDGSWSSETPITFTYQWQLDGLDIIGATANTLLILTLWAGKNIRCIVRATNEVGFTVKITPSVLVTSFENSWINSDGTINCGGVVYCSQPIPCIN